MDRERFCCCAAAAVGGSKRQEGAKMLLSREVRRLAGKWQAQTGWPKRLDWIEITGLRGWHGQRFNLDFPIMAVVGENGAGKSTILQAVASVYRFKSPERRRERFPSDFFPETVWDEIREAEISYAVREGDRRETLTLRKPTDRWRGNQKRPDRHVEYFDLRRIQPVPARVGYARLATPRWKEIGARSFDEARLERFNGIMGRSYSMAKMALTDGDAKRRVPVIGQQGIMYSGFHQGGGETVMAELLQRDIPAYSLVLIDEVESSLHPRAQRRLIRFLAERCRESELQVVLSTHSPYVLEELPLEARACIMQLPTGRREIVYGVSPDFAMTKMDDVQHAECDLYVEDERAGVMLTEILVAFQPDLRQRCRTIPYGAASVGHALGLMVASGKFPRASCVFLDGDKGEAPGCLTLPGQDPPEQVVFEALQARGWLKVYVRVGRDYSQVADACNRAMTVPDHHAWVSDAATRLFLGSDTLWQAMCAEWATTCLLKTDARRVTQLIDDVLREFASRVTLTPAPVPDAETREPEPEPEPTPFLRSPSEPPTPFGQSLGDAQG
jgi:predicted ATPase